MRGSRWPAVALVLAATCAPSGAVRAQQTFCPGDCIVDGEIQVDEIVTMVTIINGVRPAADCRAADADGDGRVRSNDVTRAVRSLLDGCSAAARGQAVFYLTLAGAVDRTDEVVADLELAVQEDPQDGWSWFLLGMVHFLRVGRALTDYRHPSDFVVAESRLMRDALDAAVPLLPYDSRIPGFRAAATYTLGVVTADPQLQALGLAQFDSALDENFLFNSFSFLGAVAPAVRPDDPLFARAIAYLDAGIQSGCTPATDPRTCGNAGRAPHNIQGSFLLFGDLNMKAGRLQQARDWYEFSLQFPGSAAWPARSLVEDRLAHFDARAALYQDADPDNDPPLVGAGPEACVTCHAE
jgi:hypothetical protein